MWKLKTAAAGVSTSASGWVTWQPGVCICQLGDELIKLICGVAATLRSRLLQLCSPTDEEMNTRSRPIRFTRTSVILFLPNSHYRPIRRPEQIQGNQGSGSSSSYLGLMFAFSSWQADALKLSFAFLCHCFESNPLVGGLEDSDSPNKSCEVSSTCTKSTRPATSEVLISPHQVRARYYHIPSGFWIFLFLH